MRTQLMRATSATVLVLLLGAGGLAQAQEARQAQPAAPVSLPDGADEAALAQRIVLPDLPPAPVDLGPDITGSLATRVPVTGAASPATPVLPLDEPPAVAEPARAALAVAAPTVLPPPAGEANAPASPPPVPPDAAVVPPVTAPAAAAVAPVPQVPAVADAPAGLDPTLLAARLALFATETVATDTPAQAADRRTQREAIAAVYAARGNAPLWIADNRLTPAARSVMARLDHAAEDGLDVTRFAVPVPRDGEASSLAGAELALSEAAVAYARQASGSRVNVARIGTIDLRPVVADAARVLGDVPGAPDAGDALRAFNPPQPGYAALRDKLAEVRQSAGALAQNRIPPGPVLKPGMSDVRVPLIRARFGLDVAADDPAAPAQVYDVKVAAAVADFQRSHRLPASGLLTARTIAALSGGNPAGLERDILANMEMWRWMPREIAPDRVEVNVPAYTVRVLRDNAVVHEARVVVGQPEKPTPIFAEQMRFIIVNPYWNVPLSIIRNEMMPKLAADPNYFANHGYEVVERNGTTFVRQPPGDGNALGRIKFMFPNSHSVYLHDTNARSFFARDKRALSHGCVRVDQPFSFAEAVMGPGSGWSEARFTRLIGGAERTVSLPRPLPILITYFTATADAQDGFRLREDVYGYAAKVKAALGLQG